MAENPTNPADKTFVVIQSGQRVTGPLPEDAAKIEAERRNQLLEGQGPAAEAKRAEVKQNLFG